MQYSSQQDPLSPGESGPTPILSVGRTNFRVRLLRATIAGVLSALLYLLVFKNSLYAPVVGDLLLSIMVGQKKYHQLDDALISTLVHTINTIIWFLMGGLPFLMVKRVSSGILLLVGIVIGLVLCGCLIIMVAVSPMWP